MRYSPGTRGRPSRSAIRPSPSVSAWDTRNGRPSSPSRYSVTETPAAGRPRPVSSTWVEIVGAGSATLSSAHGPGDQRRRPPLYCPLGGGCAADHRGDPADAADREPPDPLPLERRVDVDTVRRVPARDRLREPHLAPGARPARDVPRRDQRVRDLLPLWRVHDVLEGRPARGEPLRDDRAGRGLGGPV